MKCWLHNSNGKPVTHNRVVVITGDGRSLQDDLIAWYGFGYPFDSWAIARSYQVTGPIDHWGMVDSEANAWWAKNGKFIWKGKPQRHTLGECDGYEFDWDSDQELYDRRADKWWGSSAIFGTLCCIAMGYDRVVLAGCPLDDQGHWYGLPGEEEGLIWHDHDFEVWRQFAKQPEGQMVRSFSGFTKDVLGVPEKKWLI
jgi:hypothetical protein